MVVKPSIQWINKNPDALLINNCNSILVTLAANATVYPTPAPTLAAVQTALDAFQAAGAKALDGGRAATAAKNALRETLADLLRQLAAYVSVACNGDMTTLLLSGFPVQKAARIPIGVLPAPQSTTLTNGARSSELNGSVSPVFGASIYNWQLTPNTPGGAVITAQSTAASFTFSGLTPGVIYTVTVNAVGAAGPSNWSNPASQMAI